MSRNPKIEEILALWFDSIHCAPALRAERRRQRDAKILEIIGKNPYTIDQVLDTLHGQFQDYRREMRRSEMLSGGQQAPQTPVPEN